MKVLQYLKGALRPSPGTMYGGVYIACILMRKKTLREEKCMQYTRPHTRFLGTVSKYMYDTIRPSYRQFLPEIPKMSSRSPQNEVLGPYGTLKHSLVQPHGPKYSDITKLSWCLPIKSPGTGQTGNVPPNCIDCGVEIAQAVFHRCAHRNPR